MRYIAVTIAADGTLAALGTPDGHPFTSDPSAQRLADRVTGNGIEGQVLVLEDSRAWMRETP